jgi:DNA polymerase-4
MRLREGKVCASEIGVVIKTTDFEVYSHQKKLLNAIDCTNAVYEAAKTIFDEAWKKEHIRHLGNRASQLSSDGCIQLSFLEEDWSKEKQADEAMDLLRRKYGRETVVRSTFVGGIDPAFGGGSLKINHLK